ncbi:hypothetical protein HQ545_00720 [Candidatus Woesearchaeota archaeon]|nr:hypothetical protein [Candidatus Woesearchaeota archaeon]
MRRNEYSRGVRSASWPVANFQVAYDHLMADGQRQEDEGHVAKPDFQGALDAVHNDLDRQIESKGNRTVTEFKPRRIGEKQSKTRYGCNNDVPAVQTSYVHVRIPALNPAYHVPEKKQITQQAALNPLYHVLGRRQINPTSSIGVKQDNIVDVEFTEVDPLDKVSKAERARIANSAVRTNVYAQRNGAMQYKKAS